MKPFDQLLEEDIAAYEGRHDDLIFQAPAFYRLLVNLLDDPRLPSRLRPLVLATIAYFILPADVFPEDLHGPYGYIDDIFLCAYVANEIAEDLGPELLNENWDGEAELLPLIDDILTMDDEPIEDGWPKLMSYIGYEQLKAL